MVSVVADVILAEPLLQWSWCLMVFVVADGDS